MKRSINIIQKSGLVKYKKVLDFALLLGLAVLAFLSVAPDSLFMTSFVQMCVLAAVLVALVAFIAVVWRENPADEREAENITSASRWAYMAGLVVLMVGVIYKTVNHTAGSLESVTILVMIATKVLVQRHKDK
jgi:hypothetical protein